MARILFICHLVALITGCSYMGLVEEQLLDDSPKKTCVLMGEIIYKSPAPRPVLVVAFSKKFSIKEKTQITTVADSILLSRPGPYMLYVTEGEYSVAAFIDFNENLIYERDDFAGRYADSGYVAVKQEQVVSGLDIVVSDNADKPFDFPISIKASEYEDKRISSLENEGIINLDDNIFSEKYSSMGLWSPATFIMKRGVNIYSLEKYDESKTPILFIHGAGGSPRDFSYLVNNIDRNKYQPWFFYYPSGLKIEKISDMLNKKIKALHNKYKFKVLYITAHSMGGLVSRSFINNYDKEKKFDFLRLYISISTPYGGDKTAGMGVKYSPAHILCWKDLATGSEFLKRLYMKKMPPKIRFYLFFGYAGDSRFSKDFDDGIISLKSQLDPKAKSEAVLTYGFDEDHVSILSSNKMFEKYNEVLSIEHDNIIKEIKREEKKIVHFGEYEVITCITEPLALESKKLSPDNINTLTEKNKRAYINMLKSTEAREVIQAAKTICRLYPFNKELVKTANKELLKRFKNSSSENDHINAMSWLCNILGGSEDVHFISTLKKVIRETQNEKLKKNAEKNFIKLMKVNYYSISRFSKCINGDCLNGQGAIILPDKTKYTGEFKNGLMHGYGEIKFPDKSGYKGQWAYDRMDGDGVIIYSDRAVYTGRVSKNLRHGQGVMVFPGGMQFTGEFRNDKRYGSGTRIFQDGTAYTGKWRNGRIYGKESRILPEDKKKQGMNNRKIKSFPDGSKYIGVWKDCVKVPRSSGECISGSCVNGQGVKKFFDGMKYSGQFQRGMRHGYGTGSYPDGSKYSGNWHRNARHGQGTMTFPDKTKYTGLWRGNKRHGLGTMIFLDGRKFIGQFGRDMRHGKGTRVLTDGTRYTGSWRRNEISGVETILSSSDVKSGRAKRESKSFPDGAVYIDAFKDRPPVKQLNASLRIEKGNILYFAGNYNQASIYYGKVLELFPNNKTAYINRGISYTKRGSYIKAIDDFSKALEIDPERAVVYNNRGFAWDKRGYYNRALNDFDKALDIDPENIDALNNRGSIWIKKGKSSRAIKDFNKILKIDKKNDVAYYNRGCAWIGKENIKKALNDVQNALKLKPADKRYKDFFALLKNKSKEK